MISVWSYTVRDVMNSHTLGSCHVVYIKYTNLLDKNSPTTAMYPCITEIFKFIHQGLFRGWEGELEGQGGLSSSPLAICFPYIKHGVAPWISIDPQLKFAAMRLTLLSKILK